MEEVENANHELVEEEAEVKNKMNKKQKKVKISMKKTKMV